jgi:hypothetical protein
VFTCNIILGSVLYGFESQFIMSLGLKTIFNFGFYFLIYGQFCNEGQRCNFLKLLQIKGLLVIQSSLEL